MIHSGWAVAAVAVLLTSMLLYRALWTRQKYTEPALVEPKIQLKAYSKEQVRQHQSADDCWLIIDSKVYDVTPYVEEHPGGTAILKHAGGDATEGFHGPQHPDRVFDLIDDFLIGTLAASSQTAAL